MTIKKAELHVHLEGTIPPPLAMTLATRNQLSIPAGLISADGSSYVYRDFMDFLRAYDDIAGLIKHPRDYYDITYEYLKTNAARGAIYIEMMYSPDHARSSGTPSSAHLEAIQQAIDDAEQAFSIVGRIIMTAVRHYGADAACHVAREALQEKVNCIVGFGLGGDELNFPPKLFADAYKIAHAGGLYCTVHAGEFAPASGMLEALDYLPIQRIGHGVMAMHSPQTIARLVDQGIALEICPSSNIALGLFPDMVAHPLSQLLNAGIKVSLNSDDPPFFNTTLADEYDRAQQYYSYTDAKMTMFTQMAIEAGFMDKHTKQKLLASL